MCGRYVLSMRPGVIRQRLADQNMPVDEVPEDEEIRPTYNFAPGYHGLIYRARTENDNNQNGNHDDDHTAGKTTNNDDQHQHKVQHKLQAARWGLIPFWTKREPDYASKMRTINCRDDSLIENRGMWNTMKQRKRCIVVAEGFYEWLKKNGGKEKIPHLTKRKDGQLMCFAGLWDMVQYEDSSEKLYTYTIITTDSNPQLQFLHDRMPVILEPDSPEMKIWLDPLRVGWDRELQHMLKPFDGELECYPVDKAVGKVGNNSPKFLIPIDSKENKQNIANFFSDNSAKHGAEKKAKHDHDGAGDDIKQISNEHRETAEKVESTEDNAPLPKPENVDERELSQRIKQEAEETDEDSLIKLHDQAAENIHLDTANLDDHTLAQAEKDGIVGREKRGIKREVESEDHDDDDALNSSAVRPPVKKAATRKTPSTATPTGKRSRNATSNEKVAAKTTPSKKGENLKITSFFTEK